MHSLVPYCFSCSVLLFGDENKGWFGLHVKLGCKGLGSCIKKGCTSFGQIVNDLVKSLLAWDISKSNWRSCLISLLGLECLGKLLDLSSEIENGLLLLKELHSHVLIWIYHPLTSLSPCFHNGCSATWLLQGLLLLTVIGQKGQLF